MDKQIENAKMQKENFFSEPEFEGVSVKLGRNEYIIPGLSFAQAERLAPVIDKLNRQQIDGKQAFNAEFVNDTCVIILAAVKRNYPDMSISRLKELVDMRNIKQVFDAVMCSSGFEGIANNAPNKESLPQ